MPRPKSLLVAFALGGAALAAWLVGRGEPEPAPLARAAETVPAATVPTERPAAEAERPPTAERVPLAPSACVLRGSVTSAATGAPLAASLSSSGGSTLAGADGAFALELELGWEGVVTVEAPDHEPARITVAATANELDLGAIPLLPAGGTVVRVVDARGEPVPAAVVLTAATDPGSTWPEQPERRLGETDAEGELRVALSEPVVLFAHDGARASALETWYPEATGRRSVELRLGFEDGPFIGAKEETTGSPVEDAALRLVRVADYPATVFARTTGVGGRAAEPLPPGSYAIELDSRGLAPAGVELPDGGPRTRDAVHQLERGGTTWLLVARRSARGVVPVDRETGVRLAGGHAELESLEGPPALPEPRWFRLPGRLDAAGEDAHAIDLTPWAGVLADGSVTVRVAVSAPGHRTAFVEGPATALPPGEVVEVPLEPADPRELVVVTRDGEPYRRRVWVRDASTRSLVLEREPDAEGSLGLFGWSGDDLVVSAARPPAARALAYVESERLEDAERLVLVVDATASIAVRLHGHAPDGILCADEHRRFAGRVEDGLLVFDQLPPGAYEVGPREVLETIALRIVRGAEVLPLTLESGEPLVLDWRDEWGAPGPVRGRIDRSFAGDARLVVVPRYGPLDLPLAGGSGVRRFEVAADGTYECLGLGARPSHLMFARVTAEGQVVPLGWAPTDGVPVLRLARVRLRVDARGAAACRVVYSPSVPGRATLGTIAERFDPGEPFELLVPAGTDALSVTAGERTVRRALELGDGAVVEVSLTL